MKRLLPDKHYIIPYLISAGSVVVVVVVGLSLNDWMGYRVIAFMLLVTVSILAMFLQIAPVILAAALSALIWNYFFIPPRFTFAVGTPEDRLLLLMYFVIASINGVLTYKIRQMKQVAKVNDEKARSVKLYDTLLNSLSHELRTPITTILGCTDNLQSNSPRLSEKDKADLLNEISIASIRLNQQVENLLNMSRLESGVLQIKTDWTDINDLIYKTVHRLDANLQKFQVVVEIPDQMPLFKLDFGLIEQVLYNLILNITQHTRENTIITIRAASSGNQLVLTVSDNGKGFPDDEIQRVFEKFYRVKGSSTGGTGLGLSIVKGFVEAHKGTISLKNLPGGGSKFTITISADRSSINHLNNE